MFDRKEFIRCFSLLGKELKTCEGFPSDNPFFTGYMQSVAFRNIAENYLSEEALENLLGYSDGPSGDPDRFRRMMDGKTVGIIMAGNIPAVGFHDLLCTLSLGAKARVKLSSKDGGLIPRIVDMIRRISPEICPAISFEDKSFLYEYKGNLDFLIFSGSDSNKSLLKDEFPGVPMLARGSRFSLGVLTGEETEQDLFSLAEDMFLYFGMGCRSISYLFVPKGFDLQRIVGASSIMEKHLSGVRPYMSNVLRQRAINKLEGADFIDGGFFIMEPSYQPFPPLGCIRYAEYENISEVDDFCSFHRDEIQKKYT
ncbi:MAG: hypothetical protein J6W86_04950, partial [Bacteroidales bacterium]|nr:hypothetical protein [Bacteroidales bacterium]